MAKIIALLLVCFAAFGQTLSVINTGTTSNDGTGDSLRSAFTKANTNFYQLWSEAFTNIPVDISTTSNALQSSISGISTSSFAQRTRATSAVFFGDSVVAGSSATTTAATWWRLVSDHYGWTYTNLAFGGAVVTDLNWESQPGYSVTNYYNNILYTTPTATATNLTVFAKVGINDGADFPTTSGDHAAYLTHYYQSWLAFAAYWATPGKTLATAATASGTWSAWTNYFAASSGRQSTTSGDTLTFTTQGDAIYVAFPVSLTNTTSFGKFWVSIDGTAVELVDPNGVGFGNRNQYGTPSGSIPYSATNGFWAKRYAGYGQRRHTVLITATNNASLPTVINWVAGSQQPIGPNSGPSVFLLENLNRAANATRDATYSALRSKVNQVANYLGGDGLQVAIIRPNSVYDSANSGDGIHPNNAGMVQVAQAVRQAVDRFRGLALSTSSAGVTSAANGLTESAGTVSLGGTLTGNTTISGGAYDTTISGTLKVAPTSGDFGLWAQSDGSFPMLVDSAGSPNIYIRRVKGTIDSPTAVLNGDVLGRINVAPYAGSSTYQSSGLLQAVATENHAVGAAGTAWQFLVTPDGTASTATAMLLDQDKSVDIYNTLGITAAATGITIDGDSQFGILISRTSDSAAREIGFKRSRVAAGVQSGDVIGHVRAYPTYDGSTYPGVRASVAFEATETQTVSAQGTKVMIRATPSGSTTIADVASFSGGATALTGTLSVSGVSTLTGGFGSGAASSITTTGTALSLNGDGSFGIIANRNSNSGGKEFAIQRSRAGSTAVQSGDAIGTLGFYGHNGTTYPGRNAGVRALATETHSGSAGGTRIVVSATATGSATLTDQLVVNGGSVEVAGSLELGHATDTTLARSAAGVVTIEGVTVAERPTTTALTYSGTNVTLTATSHVLHGNTLTLTNNCLLTITSSDGASGGITIVPNSSTSYTVYLDSAIKLLGGGSSFVVTNSASETVNLEWNQTLRGGSSVILANKAVYP